jgi:hypothetical protein
VIWAVAERLRPFLWEGLNEEPGIAGERYLRKNPKLRR